jgi:hypothetical protein
MKMKMIGLVLIVSLAFTLLAGCTPAATTTAKTDTVAAASITDNAEVFVKSIGTGGKWIICTTKDLTITQDLVLEGDFVNGKKDDAGKDIQQRKIALYTQDADRKITARFTLTAPKITIKSVNASIQHGTFKGDLYVAVKDFQLVDATIEGNVYFSSEEIKTSFKMDATSKITGTQTVKAN